MNGFGTYTNDSQGIPAGFKNSSSSPTSPDGYGNYPSPDALQQAVIKSTEEIDLGEHSTYLNTNKLLLDDC